MFSKAKLKQMVVDAYHTDPELVNNDALLLSYVWGRCGWRDDMPRDWNIVRMPRPESVSRRRREAFNEGLIRYSTDATEKRMEAFINERDSHSNHVPLEMKR